MTSGKDLARTRQGQRDIASALRRTKSPRLAAEALRSDLPLERELREAIADLIEGKVHLKSGPCGFINDAEELKKMTRAGVASMVANGMKRDDAIALSAKLVGVSESTYRRMMGLKGRA